MKEITIDKELIAYCGLYCGACKKYLKEACPGCRENEKATWCQARKCCISNHYVSCADCQKVPLDECKEFNSLMSRIVSFLLRSDRRGCVERIREIGYEEFAKEMAGKKSRTIKIGSK